MTHVKNVLICPLDWGLGHATRMVAVIHLFKGTGARVILAADGGSYDFLNSRFPDCELIRLPGFSPTYPARGSMALAMLRSYPRMMREARQAQIMLEKLIRDLRIDVVISDNRYELYSDQAYTVFITHQLKPSTPGLLGVAGPFVQAKIRRYIRQFNELWIPDYKGEPNLSGRLSHLEEMPLKNAFFIGPLSRFSYTGKVDADQAANLLIIISGPEPQRTLMEKMLTEQALESGIETIILQGKPGETKETRSGNVRLVPHLPDKELAGLIRNTDYVISRPGYSTLMDLAVLGKQAIFIPTPGQTEQEYLAQRCYRKRWHYTENQRDFNLLRALERSRDFTGLKVGNDMKVMKDRIRHLVEAAQ